MNLRETTYNLPVKVKGVGKNELLIPAKMSSHAEKFATAMCLLREAGRMDLVTEAELEREARPMQQALEHVAAIIAAYSPCHKLHAET
ncbi:hypothetical protein NDU88_007094 [Pleurodeles waltl]|uniref:Uncharacterized protein n=1 Tax=Pleurodeles waltl TaxID=8319 RepID=A0AAV7RRD0_PLEWA|nr:hypothetical protein NDU88_007094 [Pleurodeles waltl]